MANHFMGGLSGLPAQIVSARIAQLCRGRVLLIGYSLEYLPALPFLIAAHNYPTYVIDDNGSYIQKARVADQLTYLDNCYLRVSNSAQRYCSDGVFDTVVLAKPFPFGRDLPQVLTSVLKLSNPHGRIILGFSPSEAAASFIQPLQRFLLQHQLKVAWNRDVPEGWVIGCIDRTSLLSETFIPSINAKKLPKEECPERVSVIIPTYNRAQWLSQAIDSVLEQSYSNIEVIVVNHGSTDDTEDVLRSYENKICYMYVENTPALPQGPARAINAGLRAASGEYICRLDDDDLFLPRKIEFQIKAFREAPENVGLIHSQHFLIDEHSRYVSYFPRPAYNRTETRLRLLSENVISQLTVMVKRECYEKVGPYDETLSVGEDYQMWVRILRHYDLRYIPLPLAKYRCHQGNISSSTDTGRISSLQRFHRELLNLDLRREFSSELDQIEDESERRLFLARAYTLRAEGALRQGLREEASQDFHRAAQLYPEILHPYRDKCS